MQPTTLPKGAAERLTPAERAELEALEREERKDEARAGLLSFTTYTYPQFKVGWVHEELGEVLDQFLTDVMAGRSPRCIICMPPRHGKSEQVSRRFPAYALGCDPDLQIILTGYAASLANRMNRDVQRIISGARYRELFPRTMLWDKRMGSWDGPTYQRNNEIFETVGKTGGLRSAGVGGGITGMGAHILIVDDPFKDVEEADSETMRNKVWEWFTTTALTRLAPGGGVLICMTRWHEDDLVGRLLKLAKENPEADQWKLVKFPALAQEDEKHRKKDEALHPARYPVPALKRLMATLGSRRSSALYQQQPAPQEGAMLKRTWWRFYGGRNEDGTPKLDPNTGKPQPSLPANMEDVIQSWDCAFKDLLTSDFVVGQVWGRAGANAYLIHQVRARMDLPETIRAIEHVSIQFPQAGLKLVEDKANGPAVISTLHDKVAGLLAVDPKGGKETRASAVTPFIEAGNVWLPDPSIAPWVVDFIEECAAFPHGMNDDQVDGMSQALMRLLFALGAMWWHIKEQAEETKKELEAKAEELDPRFSVFLPK
jgi:predicted phage terminase large subunit-like protein